LDTSPNVHVTLVCDTIYNHTPGKITSVKRAALCALSKPQGENVANLRGQMMCALDRLLAASLLLFWLQGPASAAVNASGSFSDSLGNYASQLALSALSLLFATSTAWLKVRFDRLKAKVSVLSSRIFDPFFPRPNFFDQYATNLILIGEGGSGKTTILHALSGANEAKPDVATDTLSTYTLVNEISIEQDKEVTRRLIRIYTDDYVGQNWPQGAQNPRVKARQSVIKSSTMVIVVDVVEPGSKIAPPQRRDKFQANRVKQHLNSYNDQAIQTLSTLLGTNGQVVLFINKIDLIYPLTDDAKSAVTLAFSPLLKRLEEIRGVELHIILGSAATGMGIVGYDWANKGNKSLYKYVIDHAEKVDASLLEKAMHG
jgi:hypothetical protein